VAFRRRATCDLDSPVDSRNPLASSRSKEETGPGPSVGGLTYHGILWWGKGAAGELPKLWLGGMIGECVVPAATEDPGSPG
jgi:hypothetical protein